MFLRENQESFVYVRMSEWEDVNKEILEYD